VPKMAKAQRVLLVWWHDRRHQARTAREIPDQGVIDVGDEELAVKLRLAEGRGERRAQGRDLPVKLQVAEEMEPREKRDRRRTAGDAELPGLRALPLDALAIGRVGCERKPRQRRGRRRRARAQRFQSLAVVAEMRKEMADECERSRIRHADRRDPSFPEP